MALSAEDYLRQLQALLPPGPAWPRDDEAGVTLLLAALAEELARVDGRAWQLLEEADTRTTAELFADWERVAGLPDACTTALTEQLGPGLYPEIAASDIVYFERATDATYVDADGQVVTVGPDVPRFTPGGLLIEGAETNLATHPEAFDNWSKTGGGTGSVPVVTPNDAMAPNGTLTADRIAFALNGGTLSSDQSYVINSAIATVAGTPTSAALWVKSAMAATYTLRYDFNGQSSEGADYPSLITVTPEWRRYEIRIASAIDTSRRMTLRLRGGMGTSDDAEVHVWGGQQVNAPVAGTYIPTTRAADVCHVYVRQSMLQRRAALVGRLTTLGGQSPAYYIGLAAAIGYAITITEFRCHTVEDDVDHPIHDEAWNFAWQVNAALSTVAELTVEGTVNDPLAAWGNALLECVINRLKPAHTTVLFSYT